MEKGKIEASTGYSLIEMLIVTAVGTSFFAGVFVVMGNATALLSQHQQYQEAVAMIDRVVFLISSELERHGYWSPDGEQKPLFVISQHNGETKDSCILFAYDSNNNGQLDKSNPSEFRGFRLRKQAIEMRVAQRSCNGGGWQDLTVSSRLKVKTFFIKQLTPNTLAISLRAELSVPDVIVIERQQLVFIPNASAS